MSGTVCSAALALADSGISVIPIDGQSKRPAYWLLPERVDSAGNVILSERTGKPKRTWEPYQYKIASPEIIHGWFTSGSLNVAIIGGRVSGNLLILDFDQDAARVYAAWRDRVGALASFPVVVETGKGFHVVFRMRGRPPGNEKLARRLADDGRSYQVLIETRGEGGYAITAPSYHHEQQKHYRTVQGNLTAVPFLYTEDAEILLAAARAFDEVVEPETPAPVAVPAAVYFDDEGLRQYAAGTLRGISRRVSSIGHGDRNNQLNAMAFVLGRYVAAGALGEGEVAAELERACQHNGLIDDDGRTSFWATLQSGLKNGMAQPMSRVEMAQRMSYGRQGATQ